MMILSMSIQKIEALAKSTSDAAFASDHFGRIAVWNKTAEQYFGLSANEALGRPCHAIIQGSDECGTVCSNNCSTLQAMRGRRTVGNFDVRVHTPNGSNWCNVSVLIANRDKSAHQLALHIVRPIDVRKRLEMMFQAFVRNELSLDPSNIATLAQSSRSAVLDANLSLRERDVLKLLAKGVPTKAIAAQFQISPSTVNNHVQHALRKLNAHNRLDAIRRAEASGLI